MSKFDWTQYLDLATDMARLKHEAGMRSAISRSYYFAHNVAKRYLKTLDPKSGDLDHTRMWRRLAEVSADPEYGTYGDRIREKRNKADYHDFVPGLDDSVKYTMLYAIKIVNKIKATKKPANKPTDKVETP